MIRLHAFAKVNYALEIIGLRPDGYHEIKTVLQSISLADEVSIERAQHGFTLSVGPPDKDLGPLEANTVYLAWAAVQEAVNGELPVRVQLHKHIPAGAGLGGGSADAAATIAGLNELFELRLSVDEMAEIGGRVGSDVPFCIRGGTMLGEDAGQRLTPLPPAPPHYLVIGKPERSALTSDIYRAYDMLEVRRIASAGPVVEALRAGSLTLLAAAVDNALVPVTVSMVPEVGDIKSDLLRSGALGAEMTGSGTAVYGVFSEESVAEGVSAGLEAAFSGVYRPVESGISFL